MTALAPNLARRYRPIMDKPPSPFADLARAVLPEQTSGRLARIGGVDQRVAQRWISGDASVPDDVIQLLETQLEAVRLTEPGVALHQKIEEWQAAGLHDEVIGAYISWLYSDLLKRRIR